MSPLIILPVDTFPFDPDSVAGLLFWHDFSDTSTLWQDSIGGTPVGTTGDTIAVSEDKSMFSFTRNLVDNGTVPVTWESAGQNGLGTAKFDDVAAGGYQYMDHIAALVQPSPFTYFIAATTPYITAGFSMLTGQNGCGGNLFQYGAWGSSAVRVYNGVTMDTSLPHSTFLSVTIEVNVTTQVWNGTSLDTSGNAGNVGQSAHRVGGYCNAPLTGQNTAPGPVFVGEVLEYAGALAPSDVTDIQNYLVNKWGA